MFWHWTVLVYFYVRTCVFVSVKIICWFRKSTKKKIRKISRKLFTRCALSGIRRNWPDAVKQHDLLCARVNFSSIDLLFALVLKNNTAFVKSDLPGFGFNTKQTRFDAYRLGQVVKVKVVIKTKKKQNKTIDVTLTLAWRRPSYQILI